MDYKLQRVGKTPEMLQRSIVHCFFHITSIVSDNQIVQYLTFQAWQEFEQQCIPLCELMLDIVHLKL